MSTTNTLTGPTVGINGVPQEFLCTLSAASVGADVITLSSGNGLDRFSATPGGSATTTVSIPNGSTQVWFYLMPAAGSARNISISDGNGYALSGSPISFTPSASLADPTAFSWVAGGTFRPMSLVDPNQVLFDKTDFSSVTLAGTYLFGGASPNIVLNSSGITVTTTGASQSCVLALPLSCYPSVGMAFCELTFGSSNANGGTIQWGPCLVRTDANYPGSNFQLLANSTGSLYAFYQVSSSVNGVTLSPSGAYSNFATAGVSTTGVFTQNVATLFYRPVAGSDTYASPMSSSTINSSSTGTEIASIVTGTCDQRDTTIAPYLTLGLGMYATASGASLNITRIRTGVYYGGSSLAHIPVLRTSTGAPYTDGSGNILVISQNQGPSIDGNHVYQSWEATHWYYPATDTLSPPLTRFATIRTAPYTTSNPSGATRLLVDSDGQVLYEDRVGNPNFGSWHVFQNTSGTFFPAQVPNPAYTSSEVIYNLTSANLLTQGQIVVFSSPTVVSFPAAVQTPYEVKIALIGNTWYATGVCCETAYQEVPTYLFISSGSSPTSMTSVIMANLAADSSNWDGVGIVRYQGTWYATAVQGQNTKCFNLKTGALVGVMNLGGPYSGFIPHTNMVPYQFRGANGKPYTQYRRLSHDNNFVAWGQDWSFGGTENTWMFGDLVTNRSPIFPGWEFGNPSSGGAAILLANS